MKKILKVLAYILLVIVGFAFLIYLFFPQWYLIAYTKKFIIHDKILADDVMKIPMYTRMTERTVPDSSLPIKMYITENGIKVGVPFASKPKVETIPSGDKVYEFENGSYVFIMSGDGSVKILDQVSDKDKIALSQIFGQQAISSNFEFLKAIYNMTPDDLTFRSSKAQALALTMGLTMKAGTYLATGPGPQSIVAFKSKKYEGIQWTSGDEIKSVIIQIDNLPSIRLAKMTQAQIDTVINSIEVVK